MAIYPIKRILPLGIFLCSITALAAVESVFRNAADAQLDAEDRTLDAQIRDAMLKIQTLQDIRNMKLHFSPQQTSVTLMSNGECIGVNSHTENHEMLRAKSAPVDYKVQNIQVCFANGKLARIESSFTAISQTKREKSVNKFVHKDPTSQAVNDIVLSAILNDHKHTNLRVGDLENSLTNPLRVSFKRDYYLPHLRNTAYILQLTYDLHKREAVKTNEKAVNQFINYAE